MRKPTAVKMNARATLLLGALLVLGPAVHAAPAAAQVSVGADVVSRYVWRGIDFGESLSVQPSLSFSWGGLEGGAWASYAISPGGADANENDLWVSYTFNLASGASLSVGVTDYYFPSPGSEDGFFSSDAHWIEPFASLTGPESFPVSLYGAIVAQNDPDNPIYLEASLPFTVDDVEVSVHAGLVSKFVGESAPAAGSAGFYGESSDGLTNVGVTASRPLRITSSFAPPLSVAYVLNPTTERSFLVMGLSF